MNKDHSLMLVLSAIVIINIIAIILLSTKVANEQAQTNAEDTVRDTAPGTPGATSDSTRVESPVIRTQPVVKTLMLDDKDTCPRCFDMMKYIIALNNTINMDVTTAPYKIFSPKRLPAIAFNATIEEYPVLLVGWEQSGSIVSVEEGQYKGKWYILPTYNPPYYSLTDNTTHGIVNVTFIKTDNCPGCYGINDIESFLDDAGIVHDTSVAIIGAPNADALVARYNITAVPTIIMSQNAAEYPTLRPGWDVVGTIELDGIYVLRDMQRMKLAYYDLQYKKLMKP